MLMAPVTKQWTLEEVHALPEVEGVLYELIRGELFVMTAPTYNHEAIRRRLTRILVLYLEDQRIGVLWQGQSVIRFEGSEVYPDMFVAEFQDGVTWDDAPTAKLVVEIFSPSTRTKDERQKRELYLDATIGEYWMIDPKMQSITVIRPGHTDEILTSAITWNPAGASFEAACDRVGVASGLVAIIGGPDVFGMFMDRYDTFWLSQAPHVRLPGGEPCFPGVPARSPQDILAAHGMKAGDARILDSADAVSVTPWRRVS